MMVKRSDFYWQANNTVQFNGANGMRRRLFCEPTERRDGSVTLLLRTFDSPPSVLLSMVRILHRVLGIMNRPMMNVPPVNTAVARFTQNDGQSVI